MLLSEKVRPFLISSAVLPETSACPELVLAVSYSWWGRLTGPTNPPHLSLSISGTL